MGNIKIKIIKGDALKTKADVLIMKYAQANYGLDRLIVNLYHNNGLSIVDKLPKPNEYLFTKNEISAEVEDFVFIGVEELSKFHYQEIRNFARKALISIADVKPQTRKVIFTVHGVNYGLDEIESFVSQIAGIMDAINTSNYPPGLKEIIFVEKIKGRVARLEKVLKRIFPNETIQIVNDNAFRNLNSESSDKLRSVGYNSKSKKHIFVAMPFADEFVDVFHFGIQGAVNKAGFLCERADLESFVGDVMVWVKNRIETADIVIADLTEANANVYLEVGYAWGCNIPTLLIVQDTSQLKFDVRGQRCLAYKNIKDLEEKLSKELINLNSNRT